MHHCRLVARHSLKNKDDDEIKVCEQEVRAPGGANPQAARGCALII